MHVLKCNVYSTDFDASDAYFDNLYLVSDVQTEKYVRV
jgi:hypothetical protein